MLESQAPIYGFNHQIDFSKMKEFMGLPAEDFATLIDVSASTLKSKTVSVTTLTKATPLVKIVQHLWKLSGEDENKARRWLREPKEKLLGLTPIEFMQANPKEHISIMELELRKQLYGEVMGS